MSDAPDLHTLLLRLEGRIDRLATRLDAVLDEPGLPRCATRGERLRCLEDRFDSLSSRLWWLASTLGGGCLMLGIGSLWRLLTA